MREGLYDWKRLVEQRGGRRQLPLIRSASHRDSKGPQSPALAVFGAFGFFPSPIVGHEVAEARGTGVERVSQEAEIARTHRGEPLIRGQEVLRGHRQYEGSGVVVCAITVQTVGYIEPGML